MHRLIEFCPKCNARQGMDISLGMIPFQGPGGIKEIFLYHYHCSVCNSYVRSTSMDHVEFIPAKEYVEHSTPAHA